MFNKPDHWIFPSHTTTKNRKHDALSAKNARFVALRKLERVCVSLIVCLARIDTGNIRSIIPSIGYSFRYLFSFIFHENRPLSVPNISF